MEIFYWLVRRVALNVEKVNKKKKRRDFSLEHVQKSIELVGGKTEDLASAESRGEKSKWRGEKKEEAGGGGGGKHRLGDHKGNYLHQPAKSPIKLESTTQQC